MSTTMTILAERWLARNRAARAASFAEDPRSPPSSPSSAAGSPPPPSVISSHVSWRGGGQPQANRLCGKDTHRVLVAGVADGQQVEQKLSKLRRGLMPRNRHDEHRGVVTEPQLVHVGQVVLPQLQLRNCVSGTPVPQNPSTRTTQGRFLSAEQNGQ